MTFLIALCAAGAVWALTIESPPLAIILAVIGLGLSLI